MNNSNILISLSTYKEAENIVELTDNIRNQYQEYTCANLNKLNNVIDMDWINIKDYINDNR